MLFSSKQSVGIDIADHTIELVLLERSGPRMRIAGLARTKLSPGIVVRGRIKDKEKLAAAFKELFANVKPRPVTPSHAVVGLPDSQVYIHHAMLPAHETHDRDKLVAQEAEKNIPLHADEQVMSYRVLASGKDKTEILVTAVPLEVISEWNDFFASIKVKVDSFDVEALATYRGLFARPPKSPICVADIGGLTTGFYIFDSFGLQYSNSIEVGGDLLTDEIGKATKKGDKEADADKKKIGLSSPGEPVSSAIIKGLQPVLDELKTAIKHFEKEGSESVRELILVGGSSALKGLEEYFNTNLGVSVRVGKQAVIKNDVPLQYIESVGLALRGLDPRWEERDPGLLPSMRLDSYKKKKSGGNPLSALMSHLHKDKKAGERPASIIEPMPDEGNTGKLGKEKIILGVLVLVFLALGGFGYWYRVLDVESPDSPSTPPPPTDTEVIVVEDPEDLLPTVTVLETETGWLRVRGGPGTSFGEVARVNPGESYPLLDEDDDGEWYKIQLGEETEGWVFSIYVSKDADE